MLLISKETKSCYYTEIENSNMQESHLASSADSAFTVPSSGSWDVGALAAALNVLPETTSDLALGDGIAFRLLSPSRQTLLEVFPTGPRAPVVRITGEDLQLSLFRQVEPPQVALEGLIFEMPNTPEQRWLSLGPTGEATLFYDPGRAESLQERAPLPERPEQQETPEPRAPGDVVSETTHQRTLPEVQPEKQPRITYSGRLGTDPRCRTTPRAVLVCSFPVAEKREGVEKPTWRKTVAFQELAKKVQDSLKRGMFVDVVGYEHERIRTSRDGATRVDHEVYAVSVHHR